MESALICDIKKFAVHDGDGIRTTVFLKGCPLKCVWCHNPESISLKPQMAYYHHKCVNCGECVKVCMQKAHSVKNGVHSYNHRLCIGCGKCEEVCIGNALKKYGKKMSTKELLPILLEDREFYSATGGGVTISGGECLLHSDFCEELLKELKKEKIHTAVDTCGFVSKKAIDKVFPYTDVFLYDLKAMDEEIHIKCTGQSNKSILENLKHIDSLGGNIEIRIPYVPDYNAGEMEKIRGFLESLSNIRKIKVLAYHNYAGSKYEALNMENTLPENVPSEDIVNKVQEFMEKKYDK